MIRHDNKNLGALLRYDIGAHLIIAVVDHEIGLTLYLTAFSHTVDEGPGAVRKIIGRKRLTYIVLFINEVKSDIFAFFIYKRSPLGK